ncbi:hypothetical protein BJ998_003751 [Kutzneria kofuensis]|uniref:Uncharacterized protein n=1 Tax=Kutzneria kofuensis TaxID=103725 RepID=A0A7W9KHJ9_9PSEU|nr:hypothetical protein [Kutzneria kofuensis]
MSSGQVPLWVPVVVALLGLAGVLGAQLIAGWRENQRWRRETEREELRWSREREKDRENRSYEGRAKAYAEVIGAIESFDWVLYDARRALREGGTVDEASAADLRKATAQARSALGAVNVHAPERIRAMLRESLVRRSTLATKLLANRHGEEERVLWREAQREYKIMRRAMREDLGLDAEPSPGDVQDAAGGPKADTGVDAGGVVVGSHQERDPHVEVAGGQDEAGGDGGGDAAAAPSGDDADAGEFGDTVDGHGDEPTADRLAGG